METKYAKDLKNAQEFFEQVIRIAGELELYKMLYGELPTNDDVRERMMQIREEYKSTKPLRESIQKALNKKFKNKKS